MAATAAINLWEDQAAPPGGTRNNALARESKQWVAGSKWSRHCRFRRPPQWPNAEAKGGENENMRKIANLAAVALLLVPAGSFAQTFTSGGHASATFTQVGGNIEIVLTALGGPAAANPDVLTGLFWVDSNAGAYGKVSAAPNAGSALQNDDGSAWGGESLDKHAAYKSALGFGAFNQGIGMAGFGLFGDADAFAGGGTSPILDGTDFGIVNGFAAGGIGGNENPFVNNAAKFVLSGTLGTVSGVRFQFGSATTEPGFEIGRTSIVPEASSVGLMAAGLVPFAALLRRRRPRA